jgi:cytochrome c biogenesis protein CcdA
MSFWVIITSVWNKLRFYLSFLLLFFYLIVGFLFLFSDIWASILPKGREIVGVALVLFGAFRFYVAYRRYKRKRLRIQTLKEKKKKKNEQIQSNTVPE